MNKKIFLIPILILLITIVSFIIVTIYQLSPVDRKNDKIITFTIENGTGKGVIIENLKKENLIRSAFFGKIVVKLKNTELYAGTYKLSKDLSTNEIINKISNHENIENETITITFVEGKRLNYFISEISKNFDFNEEELNEKLINKEYLDTLIEKYWFITDAIYNEDIYYPLEGYFYPDTYEFKKNSTFEEIVEKILNNMDSKLSDYKDEIEIGNLKIHEYLTLASIVELEGVNSVDRAGVAGVFYNRLNNGMTLGSDVTTYYAVKKDFSKELTYSDLNSCNGYNTRGTCVKGLPVGPISNAVYTSRPSCTPKDAAFFTFATAAVTISFNAYFESWNFNALAPKVFVRTMSLPAS